MIDRIFLVILCGALGGYAWLGFGPGLSDLMLLALVAGLSSIIVLFLPQKAGKRLRKAKAKAQDRGPSVVVDGSNVLHWRDGTPQLATLVEVLAELSTRGLCPGVIFDANVGYKISNRYLDDRALAGLLNLPADQVLVVHKGTPADEVILKAAQDLGARIVTNDRYRDWADAHPEVQAEGYLIRGGYHGGKLWIAPTTMAQGRALAAVG